jgi:hypothetical protein
LLGKRFSTQNSGAFVNGIPDKIKDRARPACRRRRRTGRRKRRRIASLTPALGCNV